VANYLDVLRRLTVNDRRYVDGLSIDRVPVGAPTLDARSRGLVRVAALVTLDGSVETLRWTIGDSLDAGADTDEVVGVLLAVAPLIGVARVASAAPKVALALDYDIDAALETLNP
jgi:alkylhydroperoxidase/carboxymuconolactone decarboxylase family protein YurZ